MMELLEFAPDDLGGDLALRIHELLSDAWPDKGDYYRTRGAPTAVVILRRAPVYERQVAIGGELLEIGMLGGVVVAPDHRRLGHSQTLIRHAHERLPAPGALLKLSIAQQAIKGRGRHSVA